MQNDEAINEVARRLAAAYASYQAGYAGVDILLKRTPERAGKGWRDLAALTFYKQKEIVTVEKMDELIRRAAELLIILRAHCLRDSPEGPANIAVSQWLRDAGVEK